MALIVQKYGGTSVAEVGRLKKAALRIKREIEAGNQVVVVVSAMAGITDQLDQYTSQISQDKHTAEHDVVLSAGEQVSCGLLALALREIGIASRSFLSWQLPIITDDAYTQANIINVVTDSVKKCLESNEVPVIAGFQGVSSQGRLTTLGRGGSDLTAVAVAIFLEADRCDIYTDVSGVYTADPRVVQQARKLNVITYEEMLELSTQGAKVLQPRSVKMAMAHCLPLRVLSSFSDEPGTDIISKRTQERKTIISGITHSLNEAKVTLASVPNKTGVLSTIFSTLADAHIPIDMIVKNVANTESADLTFAVSQDKVQKTMECLKVLQSYVGFVDLNVDTHVAKVSVVGTEMLKHMGVASLMFKTLAEIGINIQVIASSAIKLSVLLANKHTDTAIRALHTAYQLDAGVDP